MSFSKKCFASWGSPDNLPRTYSTSCNHSHANFTYNPRQQWTSVQSTTSFSAHGVGSQSLPTFHHARTASSCIPCALSTRLASEDAVSNNILKPEAQSSVAGSEMTMASSSLNVWASPAPETVLQLLLCKRSRRCKLPECQCMSNGLKCTKL